MVPKFGAQSPGRRKNEFRLQYGNFVVRPRCFCVDVESSRYYRKEIEKINTSGVKTMPKEINLTNSYRNQAFIEVKGRSLFNKLLSSKNYVGNKDEYICVNQSEPR